MVVLSIQVRILWARCGWGVNVLPVGTGAGSWLRCGRRELDNRVMENLHQLRESEGLPPYDAVIG